MKNAGRVLQINLRFDCPPSQLASIFGDVVGAIAATPGLRWKIWLLNDETREAGGIYAFDDDAAIDAYLGGPIGTQMRGLPHLLDVAVKRFDTIPALNPVTRAPAV